MKVFEDSFQVVTVKHADLVREYFQNIGVHSGGRSKEIKILLATEKKYPSYERLRFVVEGREIFFDMHYESLALVLKLSEEKLFLNKLKGVFPNLKEGKLATLCLFKTSIGTDLETIGDLLLFGKPIESSLDLEKTSRTVLTSDLLWIKDPEEPQNHVKACQQYFLKKAKPVAKKSLLAFSNNFLLSQGSPSCSSPDPRQRLLKRGFYREGDPSCASWFEGFSQKVRSQAVARCVASGYHSALGRCELRARPNTAAVLYEGADGQKTYPSFGNYRLLTSPRRIQFHCDEMMNASWRVLEEGSWFRYYESECLE